MERTREEEGWALASVGTTVGRGHKGVGCCLARFKKVSVGPKPKRGSFEDEGWEKQRPKYGRLMLFADEWWMIRGEGSRREDLEN